MKDIVIFMEGGLVSSVIGEPGQQYTVVDFDDNGACVDEISDMHIGEDGSLAYISQNPEPVSPGDFVPRIVGKYLSSFNNGPTEGDLYKANRHNIEVMLSIGDHAHSQLRNSPDFGDFLKKVLKGELK